MNSKIQPNNPHVLPMSDKKDATAHPLQNYYSRIYKSYDLVNTLFTFGRDNKWRNDLINVCLKLHPEQVLDLCSGTGDLAIGLKSKAKWPVQVTAYDRNAEMLSIAIEKAVHKNTDILFLQGDAAEMPFHDAMFDAVMIGFGFRNLTWQNAHKEQHLSEISRILKTGAQLLILESANPENPVIRFLYRLYLKGILIPLGGLISGNMKAYRYLAGSSAGFYSFMALKEMLVPHQLQLKRHKSYFFGSVNLLIATKIN